MKAIHAALHGLDAGDELSVSVGTFRIDREDSQRTKVLKEALRESVDLYEKSKQSLPKTPLLQKATEQIVMPNKLKHSLQRTPTGLFDDNFHHLQSDHHADDLSMELADAQEYSKELGAAAKSIDHLCTQLASIRPATVPSAAITPALDVEEDEDLRVVARPPDEAVNIVKSRVDQCALQYIHQHVVFDRLEDLDQELERSVDYRGVRKIFPEHYFHHHNLPLLTDYRMQDEKEFRRIIWAPPPPAMAEEIRKRSKFSAGVSGRRRSISGKGNFAAPLQVSSPSRSLSRQRQLQAGASSNVKASNSLRRSGTAPKLS